MNDREWEDFATEVMFYFEDGGVNSDMPPPETGKEALKAYRKICREGEKRLKEGDYTLWKPVSNNLPGATCINASMGLVGERIGIFSYQSSSPVCYLQEVLATGRILPQRFEKRLGVKIDYHSPSEWQKRSIKWQVAAQVIACNLGRFNVTHICNAMHANKRLVALLGLKQLPYEGYRDRELEDVIRKVNPCPNRKGRPPKEAAASECLQIVDVPGVIKGDAMNLQCLSLLLQSLAQVLKLQFNTHDQITDHPVTCYHLANLSAPMQRVAHFWLR